MENIYIDLTNCFNNGKHRAILSSGQAVVLHRLAIMSKDGDWIVKEDEESLDYILQVLDEKGAKYRFGAPFDMRWLAGGWSSHFEFIQDGLRIRTDFVSRPPRISAERLEKIWKEQENRNLPFVDLADLAELKKTNREKDYAIIGELSRRMTVLEDRLLYLRSAREIMESFRKKPKITREILNERNISTKALKNLETLEAALDAERRRLIHANEQRLARYISASQTWAATWKKVEREISELPLVKAHNIVVSKAVGILPFKLPEEVNNG